MRFRLKTHTSVHTNTIENGGVCLRKRRFSKTLSRVEVFVKRRSASLCGRAKTEVFENDYVTGIGMSQFHLRVKSINNRSNMAGYLALMLFALISTLIACLELNAALIKLYTLILRKKVRLSRAWFLIRFRWSSVDGRKRCKNASVDEKLFIRFQETENGGFRNALVWTGPQIRCEPTVESKKIASTMFFSHEKFGNGTRHVQQ